MNPLAAMFALLGFPLRALTGNCPAAPAEIEAAIRLHMAALGAAGYCEARTVKAEGGIVAIYTDEGACAALDLRAKPGACSNNWVRYMVVHTGPHTTPPVEVGGKGGVTDTGVRVSDGLVEGSGLSRGPGDAMCCPSVPETRRFIVLPSGLIGILRSKGAQ